MVPFATPTTHTFSRLMDSIARTLCARMNSYKDAQWIDNTEWIVRVYIWMGVEGCYAILTMILFYILHVCVCLSVVASKAAALESKALF